MPGQNRRPSLWVPERLSTEHHLRMPGRVPKHRLEPRFRAKVADPLSGPRCIMLELGSNFAQPVLRTDRRPGDDARPGVLHITDDRVAPGGEPEIDPGVDDLVGSRIPAVLEYQLSGTLERTHPPKNRRNAW